MSPTRSAASTRARCCSATARSRPCTCSPPFSVRSPAPRWRRSLPPAVLTTPPRGGPAAARRWPRPPRAGWPPPLLVPEPVGAARYFADVLRRPVPFGSSLAVFDFGGGTPRRRRRPQRRRVLRGHRVGRHRGPRRPGHRRGAGRPPWPDHRTVPSRRVAGARTAGDHRAARRDRRLFWDDVRGAKEMLSRVAVAPVTVPGLDSAAHLTREELESVAAPLLRRAVQETGLVIRNCGLRPDELAGLFLVGSSRCRWRPGCCTRAGHRADRAGAAGTARRGGALAELAPAGQAAAVPAAPGFAPAPNVYRSAGPGPLGPSSPAPYLNNQPTSGPAPVSGAPLPVSGGAFPRGSTAPG